LKNYTEKRSADQVRAERLDRMEKWVYFLVGISFGSASIGIIWCIAQQMYRA